MNLSRRSLFRAVAGALVGRAVQRALPASNVAFAPRAFVTSRNGIDLTNSAALLKALWPAERIEALIWDPGDLIKKLAEKR